MDITVSDYINVNEKLKQFDFNDIKSISFLPFNFDQTEKIEELLYDNSTKVIRTLFRNNEIPDERIEKHPGQVAYRQLNHFEWLAPTIFITSSFLSENHVMFDLSLHLISHYLYDFFKGLSSEKKKVKIEIIVEMEKDKAYKKITYEGDGQNLEELANIIKNIK